MVLVRVGFRWTKELRFRKVYVSPVRLRIDEPVIDLKGFRSPRFEALFEKSRVRVMINSGFGAIVRCVAKVSDLGDSSCS